MTNRWLLVADDETWSTLVKEGYWKLSRRYKKVGRKVRIGDKAIAYVKLFSAIYGIVGITSEPMLSGTDTEFPITFSIKPEIFLNEPTSIRPLIDTLSFIRDKKRWYSYFQTSLRRIPEKDFELFRGYLIREQLRTK